MRQNIDFNQHLSSESAAEFHRLLSAQPSTPSLLTVTTLRSRLDTFLNKLFNPPSTVPIHLAPKPPSTVRTNPAPQPPVRAPTATPTTSRTPPAGDRTQTAEVVQLPILATSTTPAPIRKCHCRRRNIIIHGLKPSKPNPTNMDLKTDAKSFLFTKLNLSIEPQSVHLIGSGDSKPFRVRFRTVQDKKKVLGNCHLLKPYRWEFRVTNDLPYEQRQIMKLLQHRLNIQKKKGNRVRIKDFVLYINGVPDFDAETIYNETPTAEPSQHATSPSTSFLLPSLPPPTPPRTKRRAPGPPTSTTN